LGLIDTHAHLTSETVWPLIDQVLESAKLAGVERIVNICTDKETLIRGLQLVQEYSWISNVAATTPHDVEKEGEAFFSVVENAVKQQKLIAIGETGLDYHYEHSPRKQQEEFLRRYFELAKHCHLPIVIHCRNAFEDLFRIADEQYKNLPLLLHCFTGTLDEAKKALLRGWKISFSGMITFKKSEALRLVAKEIPIESLFIETDTPYLAPQSRRGHMNQPAFLVETATCIAGIKQMHFEDLVSMTTQNALQFFAWSKQT